MLYKVVISCLSLIHYQMKIQYQVCYLMISTYCGMFASMEVYNILSEARLNMTSSVCYFFLLDMWQLRNKSNLPVCNKILYDVGAYQQICQQCLILTKNLMTKNVNFEAMLYGQSSCKHVGRFFIKRKN